jgi:hypothetical protein
MRILIPILTIILFLSCGSEHRNSLIGTWNKDSSSNGPSKILSRPYESGTLTLKNDGAYEYNWMADDIGGNRNGKYFIIDSISGSKILKLERDSGNFFIYRILEFNDRRFKAISTHHYTTLDDSTIFFDMIDVFKKIKSH